MEAPEPIIEIIIKDANETAPETSNQPIITKTKKKKEKVHVFYVNYKKDENNKLHLESPIASLNNDEVEDEDEEEEEIVQYQVTPLPPIKSTTLRTIIHPDSEKYLSNSGIHVTFGSEDKSQTGHILEEHDAESVQRQVVAVPVSQSNIKSQYHVNARNDYQGQARSPLGSSSFFQSSAPWQHQSQQQQQQQQQQHQFHAQQQAQQQQQQQLPLQHSTTYFKPPSHTAAASQQHTAQHSSSSHNTQQQQSNNFYQKPAFHLQNSQPKPHYNGKPSVSALTPVQQYQRPTPLSQIHQQLQQQSQYYVSHNQLYPPQQLHQLQQQQHQQQHQWRALQFKVDSERQI